MLKSKSKIRHSFLQKKTIRKQFLRARESDFCGLIAKVRRERDGRVEYQTSWTDWNQMRGKKEKKGENRLWIDSSKWHVCQQSLDINCSFLISHSPVLHPTVIKRFSIEIRVYLWWKFSVRSLHDLIDLSIWLILRFRWKNWKENSKNCDEKWYWKIR